MERSPWSSRIGWIVLVIVAVGALLIVAGSGSAQTGRFEDISGNGHDLEGCDPGVGGVELEKFGEGFNYTSMETDCTVEGSPFGGTEDRSWTWAGNWTTGAEGVDAYAVLESEESDGTILWQIGLRPADQQVQIAYEDDGLGSELESCSVSFTGTGTFDAGVPTSFWARLEAGDQLSDTVFRVKAFVADGSSSEQTCSIADDPLADTGADFRVEDANTDAGPGRGANISEVRFWDGLPATTTLNAIADPTNPDHTQEPAGGEEAVWPLEAIPAQEVEGAASAGLAIHFPAEINSSDTWTVSVWVQDSGLEPVAVNKTPNITLARPDGTNIEWWNQSTEQVEVDKRFHQTSRKVSGSFVWTFTFRNVSAGAWIVSAETTVDEADGGTVNITGSEHVQIRRAMPINIAGLDASALIQVGSFAIFLIWALDTGLFFAGISAIPGIVDPLLADGISHPFGFKFALILCVIALFLEFLARNTVFPSTGERPGRRT